MSESQREARRLYGVDLTIEEFARAILDRGHTPEERDLALATAGRMGIQDGRPLVDFLLKAHGFRRRGFGSLAEIYPLLERGSLEMILV